MIEKNMVVGSVLSPDWLRKRSSIMTEIDRQLLQGIENPGAGLTLGQLQLVTKHENPFKTEPWLQQIIEKERKCLIDFFGHSFDLSKFEKTLKRYGHQKIQEWKKLGLEPHFFPKISMLLNNDYPGWETKPEQWFYSQVTKGKIFRSISGKLRKVETVELEGITVLIDVRLKPNYDNGKQVYENDNLLGPIIEELREKEKIAKYDYGPQSSRFDVSADEWQKQIRLAVARELGFKIAQVRLERVIEANIIPQIYLYMSRKDDGKTNTWAWYEEYLDRAHRLDGGLSDYGGLAHVHYFPVSSHWDFRSFRFLAVL